MSIIIAEVSSWLLVMTLCNNCSVSPVGAGVAMDVVVVLQESLCKEDVLHLDICL
jgi:uncharacterized protein YfeS